MRSILACLVVLGCAGASSTKVGRGLYSIECRRSVGNCYEEAATVCPDGFDVENASDQSGAYAHTNTFNGTTTTTVTPVVRASMLVRCRGLAETDD